RGEPGLERRVRDAELGEVAGDLLEIVELPPPRLEEDQAYRQSGDGGREPAQGITDALREPGRHRDRCRYPIHGVPPCRRSASVSNSHDLMPPARSALRCGRLTPAKLHRKMQRRPVWWLSLAHSTRCAPCS